MGKFPQLLRNPTLPLTSLLRKPQTPEQAQSQTPVIKPQPYFPKTSNPAKKKPKTITQRDSSAQTPKTLAIINSPELSKAKTLFNSIVCNPKTRPDHRLCNSVLQSYSAISTLNDSISLLRHMTKTLPTFNPDHPTYHILLAQSCSSSDSTLSAVHQILNLMVADKCPPHPATIDLAVRSLCAASREDDAAELVKESSLKHTLPDTYTYNFLIKRLCKTKSISIAHSFIDEMRKYSNLKPDLVTYTILIDNVCNSRNLGEAMRLLAVLQKEGFKPDCFVYNTIMKGYCMLEQGSQAILVYNKMKDQGVEPDLVTYNTLIFGLSKSGRVKEALKFLTLMAGKGHFPDAVTYTSLMNGLCREGSALAALGLLKEMESKGCSPNDCTYNTLLHGLCKSKLLEKGIELYGIMKTGGMKLENASYATLVRTLCRAGRVAEAYEVFDYAIESKSLKDVTAYSTLESTLKYVRKAKEQGLAK